MNGISNRYASLAPILLLAFLTGCSGAPPAVEDLTDQGTVEIVHDIAPLTRADGRLPFSFTTEDGLTIGYNLRQQEFPATSFYWLRVVIRNDGQEAVDVAPTVAVQDATGLAVPLVPRDALVQTALADTGGPRVSTGRKVAGVASAASPFTSLLGLGPFGTVFSVMGSTMSALAGASGDQGLTGTRIAQWAMTHWLKPGYSIPPEGAVAGVLAFEAPRELPLNILINVGERTFRFASVGSMRSRKPLSRQVDANRPLRIEETAASQ